MPSAPVGDCVALLLLTERACDRKPAPPQGSRWFSIIVFLLLDRQPFRANDLYLPQKPSYIYLARKPHYSSYILYYLFVKVFDVLSVTSPPLHLRVFSTLLCLFSSSSNSLLSCYPLISPYMPPISELAALVSFCPPHVTQSLSCVVCLNSTILPLSALVTLTIFRTQFFFAYLQPLLL